MHAQQKKDAGLVCLAPRSASLADIDNFLREQDLTLDGLHKADRIRACDIFARPVLMLPSVAYALLDAEGAPDHGRGVLV